MVVQTTKFYIGYIVHMDKISIRDALVLGCEGISLNYKALIMYRVLGC